MKRKINESDFNRIVKLVTENDDTDDMGFLKKMIAKLKGVSQRQIEYNVKNNLPWDWKGTKEGFYEKIEKKINNTGSN
jgi:hypothetical protein